MKTTMKMIVMAAAVMMSMTLNATETSEIRDRTQSVLVTSRVAASYAENVMRYVEYGAMSLAVDECVTLKRATKKFQEANAQISSEELYAALSETGRVNVSTYMDTILAGLKTCNAL